LLSRKCFLIETVNAQWKNTSPLEHSRHRSVVGFMVDAVCTLIADSWQAKKPLLNLRKHPESSFIFVKLRGVTH